MQDIESAVNKERARCARIVQAARCGDIDQDFRTILHFINSGDEMRFDDDSGEYLCDSDRKDRALAPS